jgi:hypothetical protein
MMNLDGDNDAAAAADDDDDDASLILFCAKCVSKQQS